MTARVPHRERLPNRRLEVVEELIWHLPSGAEQKWTLGVGFDAEGQAREVFVDGRKVGSELDALMDDAAILVSILLQAGFPAGHLAARLVRNAAPRPEASDAMSPLPPASAVGFLLDHVAVLEREHGEEMHGAAQALKRMRTPALTPGWRPAENPEGGSTA